MAINYSNYSLLEGMVDDKLGALGGSLGASANSATSTSFMSGFSSYAGPIMGAIGGIGAGLGAYFSAESAKNNLKFQSDMAALNARMAENTAQSIMQAGEKAIGQQTLRAGKVKSAQRASQAARGIVAGEGNAAEEVATTDLMKETDSLTINANAVRQAWAARTQAVNAQNESLLKGTTADSINPFAAAGTSLINSATSVASSWYQSKRMDRIAALLGGE